MKKWMMKKPAQIQNISISNASLIRRNDFTKKLDGKKRTQFKKENTVSVVAIIRVLFL